MFVVLSCAPIEVPRDIAEKEEVSVASKTASLARFISPESNPVDRPIGLILMYEFSLTKFAFALELKIGSKPSGKLFKVSRPPP